MGDIFKKTNTILQLQNECKIQGPQSNRDWS